MEFDSKRFMKTKFSPRTADVPVPEMKDFFPEGMKPVWRVRGLTGQELGQSSEAADRNKNIAAILEGLAGGADKEKTDAMKALLGFGGATPVDIAKRLEMLVLGSVAPKCDQSMAVRICEVFPIEFFQITNKITEVTGRGQVPGKPQPSGKTAESAPASHSATPGGGSSTK